MTDKTVKDSLQEITVNNKKIKLYDWLKSNELCSDSILNITDKDTREILINIYGVKKFLAEIKQYVVMRKKYKEYYFYKVYKNKKFYYFFVKNI